MKRKMFRRSLLYARFFRRADRHLTRVTAGMHFYFVWRSLQA